MYRRDFLRALSLGAGSILLGQGRHLPGWGAISPVGYNGRPSGIVNLRNATYPRWNATRLTSRVGFHVGRVSEADIFDLILRVKGRSGKVP